MTDAAEENSQEVRSEIIANERLETVQRTGVAGLSDEKRGADDPDWVAEAPNTLSKNQQKKLKRKLEWEEGREARKAKRKIKNKERKARKRAVLNTVQGEVAANGTENSKDRVPDGLTPVSATESTYSNWKEEKKRHRAIQLPITFVFDCQFDDLMTDGERISLASQLTRAYSDNRKASLRAHVVISSFGGNLKDRFEGILARHHEHWQGVRFREGDFVGAAEEAKGHMKEIGGGQVTGALKSEAFVSGVADGEVVYLTSDSPNTLESLKPNSVYIIGGLVDKNRHKGICYKKAMDRGVNTAKLPIGEFLQMRSRAVLATNHVSEIMLKWLECGDWGKAFLQVIPKRKGGTLKDKEEEEEEDVDEEAKESPKALDALDLDALVKEGLSTDTPS